MKSLCIARGFSVFEKLFGSALVVFALGCARQTDHQTDHQYEDVDAKSLIIHPPYLAGNYPDVVAYKYTDDFESDPFRMGWTEEPSDSNQNNHREINASWLASGDVGSGRAFHMKSGVWYGPPLFPPAMSFVELSFNAKSAGNGIYGMRFFDRGGKKMPGSANCQVERSADARLHRTMIAIPVDTAHVRIFFRAADDMVVDDVSLVAVDDQVALNYVDESYAAMRPVGDLSGNGEHWEFLRSTKEILASGGELSVVCIGDSLANDLAQSQFHLLVALAWPGSRITLHNEPANNGRPRDFVDHQTFRERVLWHRPDLVLFGGISTQEQDFPELALLALRLRSSQIEFAVFTGTMLMPEYWNEFSEPPVSQKEYRRALVEVGKEERFSVFDLGAAWEGYVLDGKESVERFRRDSHHANDRGKQIFGRLIARWLLP